MQSKRPSKLFSAIAFLAAIALAPSATAATITDLGTLGGFYNIAYASGINSAGQIVGRSDTKNTGGGNDLYAFLYTTGRTMTDLNINGSALGLNAAGQVVGARLLAKLSSGATHAFLSSGGTMTDLGTLPGGGFSTATGINASGQISGHSQLFDPASKGTTVHAFLYSAGAMKDLGTLNGSGSISYAFGINAAGQVAGVSEVLLKGALPNHAFLYSAGNMTDLGVISGQTGGSSAAAINDSGQIAGSSSVLGKGSHAFLYSAGVMTDLGTIPGNGLGPSYGQAINNLGQVVGYAHSNTSFSERAFLSGNGVMTDLNLQLPANSGWILTSATGINDAGQIVGYGTTKTGQIHAFLLEGAVADPSKVQTITFAPFTDVKLGAAPFDIDYLATSNYGLPVSFASSTPTVCTVSSVAGIQQSTVSTVSGGTCTIVATQPGNANYLPATPVSQSFTVIGAPATPQTLTFKALPDLTFGAAPFPIAGNASSGLVVMFTASPAAVCTVGASTITGATVTLTGAGTCSITASQTGSLPGSAIRGPLGVRFLSGDNALAPRATFAPAVPITQTFTVKAATGAPAITAAGIVPVYSTATTIQSGSWVSIYGTGLAAATATWNGDFPTTLGGVTVTINGKKAYLWFVSATQINLQVPDDTSTGDVSVTLTNTKGSWTSAVTLGPLGPSFSLLDGKHVTGIILRSDASGAFGGGTYDIVGPTGTSLGYKTVAAKPGDSLVIFGVGFGPTSPAVPAGKVFAGAASTTNAVQLTIAGKPVTPAFAGLSSAGLYQINVTVPAGLGTGDVTLLSTTAGVQTQAGVVLSLQ